MAQTAPSFEMKESATQAKGTVEVLQWVCDVCKKARFADFNDACKHEEQCRKEKESRRRKQSSTTGTPGDSKTSSGEAHPKRLKLRNHNETTHSVRTQEHDGHKSDPENSVVSIDSGSSDDEATCTRNKKRRSSFNNDAKKDESLRRIPPPLRTETPRTSRSGNSKNNGVAAIFQNGGRGSSKPPPSRSVKPKLNIVNKPMTGIFGKGIASNNMKASEAAALLAEHRAAEFAAKRRADGERNRERQRKRNEARQQLHQNKASRAHAPLQSLPSKKKLINVAPRFPVPSHVLGPTTPCSKEKPQWGVDLADEHMLEVAKQGLCKTAKHPAAPITEEKNCDHPLLLEKDHKLQTPPQATDLLYEAMANLLIPPSKRGADRDDRLWSDNYTMQRLPEDVCGDKNREAAMELLEFVNEWKQQRQQVLVRMAEKRQSHKTKKRKKAVIDDDIWCDSDDEDDSLVNVCLLTGPSGSGKTSLVHAVAKQAGCVVLEMNSTERRGGQALRHSIEEATQSHSSLTMLKQSNQSVNIETDTESAEEGSSVAMILIDEIDILFENEGDSGFWTALSSLTKKAKCPIFMTANRTPDTLIGSRIRFTHVTTALPTPSECAAKMWQIVKMEGFSWRKDAFSTGDAVKEQLSWIAQLCRCDLRRIILELQLFSCSDKDPLHRVSPSSPESKIQCSTDVHAKEWVSTWSWPIISDIKPKTVLSDRHSILTLKGRNFCNGEDSLSWEILIGDQVCPAIKVMDDATLLAVCPPCLLPAGVNESGLFRSTLKECLSCRYAPVSIRARTKMDTVSIPDTSSPKTTFGGGNACSGLIQPLNLQYNFPPMEGAHESESEFEFCCDNHSEQNCGSAAQHDGSGKVATKNNDKAQGNQPTELIVFDSTGNNITEPSLRELKETDCIAEKLLEEAVIEWTAWRNDALPSPEKQINSNKSDRLCRFPDLETCEWTEQFQCASDAAFLEDTLINGGIPQLSGAVRGFGNDLVDVVDGGIAETSKSVDPTKLCRSRNSKTISYERLFSSGWNDSCYFYGNCDMYLKSPTNMRDKQLLMHSGTFSRGSGLSECHSVSTLPSPTVLEDSDSPSERSSMSSTDDTTFTATSSSEEDMFLPCHIPFPLFSLPSILRKCFDTTRFCDSKHVEAELEPKVLRFKKDQTGSSFMRNLSSLFDDDAKTFMSCRGLATEMDASFMQNDDYMDSRLFLDYLPALKTIAANEVVADEAYQKLLQENSEVFSGARSGRRSTRRSKQLGRRNYFEGLLGTARVGDSECAKHLSREFANAGLVFSETVCLPREGKASK